MSDDLKDFDVTQPLWDQKTFWGRFQHFAWVTDPRSLLASEDQLDEAKILIEKIKNKEKISNDVTREQIIYAKKLYESAFHPDSHEKQNIFGRMSFQVPGGMLITGCMLQFYRTTTAVVFWQWINQSFNALVNYTNRNANSPLTTTQMGVAYVSATASAMGTAFGLKKILATAPPVLQRYVPFAAVAAANCVNIPLMRQTELFYGVDLTDENGNVVIKSKYAATKGISQVVFSRIVMCAPGMLIMPVIMERLEKLAWMKRITHLHMPIQVVFIGCFLTLMVPAACALFPQQCCVTGGELKRFESSAFDELEKKYGADCHCKKFYFNKGL